MSLSVVEHLSHQIPILGVCLGHQSIAQAFGGDIIRAAKVMHGKVSLIYHSGGGFGRQLFGSSDEDNDFSALFFLFRGSSGSTLFSWRAPRTRNGVQDFLSYPFEFIGTLYCIIRNHFRFLWNVRDFASPPVSNTDK